MASISSSYNPREIDNTEDMPGRRAPLITGNQTYTSVTEMVCRVAEDPQPRLWWILFGMASLTASMFLMLIGFLIYKGVTPARCSGLGLSSILCSGWALATLEL